MTKMYIEQPFSSEKLEDLFQATANDNGYLLQSEIYDVEYKRNYNGNSRVKYARIMAGFANNEGGYIIFGVDDSTREPVGMSNNSFDNLTTEDIGKGLNNIFAPAINFRKFVHVINGKRYGLLYTYEAKAKPIIAYSNAGNDGIIRNGDIFYRYGAEIERIRYPELASIVEKRQEQQLNRWLEFMQEVARIGVDNVRLFNMLDGTISSSEGQVVLSEELLNQINFIDKGNFDEIEGQPALSIINEAKPLPAPLVEPTRIVDKPTFITILDVYRVFLEQQTVEVPLEYLKVVCHGTSKFVPIYFYIQQANLSLKEAEDFLKTQLTRSRSRDGIVERLKSDAIGKPLVYKTTSSTSNKCQQYKQIIIRDAFKAGIPVSDVKFALKAVRMLNHDEVIAHAKQIFSVLQMWFAQYFTDKTLKLDTELKNTICYLDYLLFRSEGGET